MQREQLRQLLKNAVLEFCLNRFFFLDVTTKRILLINFFLFLFSATWAFIRVGFKNYFCKSVPTTVNLTAIQTFFYVAYNLFLMTDLSVQKVGFFLLVFNNVGLFSLHGHDIGIDFQVFHALQWNSWIWMMKQIDRS